MKILAKLLFGFIAVAVLCGVVGIVGITQLGTMNKDLETIQIEVIPSINNILEIATNLQKIKVGIRTLANPAFADDAATIQRQRTNIETARADYAKNMADYDPIARTPEEDKLWKASQAAMAVAKAYNDELLSLIDKAIAAGPGALRDSLFASLVPIMAGERRSEFDNAITAIKNQSDYVKDYYGVKEINRTQDENATGSTILVAVTILAFLVAIALGIFLGTSISGSLKKSVSILDKMAAGDLSERLVVKSRDEFALVAASLGKVGDSVNLLVTDAGLLAKAAVEGKLATRADATKHQGDYRKVVEGVNKTLDSVIGPLNVAANYVDRISKGDIPPKITDAYQGDFNEIKNNLNQAIDAVNALVTDAGILVNAAVDGKLATRADATRHQGDYRKVVEGVNKTLDAVIGPLNVAANYVDRISKGDIPPKITDAYQGDFNEIKSNLNQAIDAVNALVADAGILSKAAVEGKLATRADASKHQGDYRKIVDGVNKTLDSVIGPLNVAANYVARISKGDIPQKITDVYQGDFNEIKNNLNQAIDAVNALVVDAGMLAKAAVEGRLATRADATKHQNDFRKVVEGVNQTLDSVIGPLNVAANYVDRISKGDIPPKINDTYHGDFNEIKNNLNQAIDAVNALVNDAGLLVKAAIDGKLATRADATKHQGDYRKIVDGVNKTLDAVIGPLNVAAAYVDKISAGNIPSKITDTYNGDFNEIKNNLNKAIDAVNGLVADAGMLVQAAIDGKLATRADASKHQGDYRKIVDGVNKTLDAVIGPLNVAADYVDKISAGNIPPKITDSYNGDFNTIKN
ncbi:MAG: HAMP domain-containing protein, partial [Spirochaetota bacterium]